MPERLYLSLWLKEYDGERVLAALGKVLEAFPFSDAQQGVRSVSVHPLDWSEPPAMEQEFAQGTEASYAMDLALEFQHPDCAYQIVVYWDLWEFRRNGEPGGWRRTPRAVEIFAYGPEFEGREEERGHLELDLGLESPFLAEEEPGDFAFDYGERVQANIQKLVDLTRGLSQSVRPQKRLLWTESGENFAEKIEQSFE